MSFRKYYSWKYPDVPEDVAPLLLELKNSLVVVGVVGRSKCSLANKMSVFGMQPEETHEPANGQIMCYYKPGTSTLLLHFESTHDEVVLGQKLLEQTSIDFDHFYGNMRSQFVRMMLLALHTCHIVVYVETGQTFDPALVTICQLLKYVREQHLLEFLPQLLRETSAGNLLGDRARLCTPRILFIFENYPADVEKTREFISTHEFQTEDKIYELFRQYNIVMQSASNSLLALPNNKQFVFYNANEILRPDRLLLAIDALNATMYKQDVKEEEEDLEIIALAPFEGFVKPFGDAYTVRKSDEQLYRESHTVWHFLQRHVQDALEGCFDEGSFKQLSQSPPFQLLNFKTWHMCMVSIHKLLVGNVEDVNYVSTNAHYQAYLRDFTESLNYEKRFWYHLSELGLKKGISAYKHSAAVTYGSAAHKQMLANATLVFEEEGRGPYAELALAKLNDVCLRYWHDGRQQCEFPSLRGNPCILPRDVSHDKHSSGVVHISSCNCGRTLGRREDPYTLRQANYDYYEHMAVMCNLCVKVKRFQFPVFTPSISDYRAAAFEAAFPLLLQAHKNRAEPQVEEDSDQEANAAEEPYSQPATEAEPEPEKEPQASANEWSQPMSATYGSDLNMSIAGFGVSLKEGGAEAEVEEAEVCDKGSQDNSTSSDTSTESEIELQPKERSAQKANQILISTTEYLPGLVHMCSGLELLPLFPSWSLACVGPSSIYSHNTGLQEHFQSGFLSGANYLLPWDVQVRLVQPHYKHQQQQLMGKKNQRYRKQGDRLALKIFIGFEYECSRGHRFMMRSPERVLRGGADIERDTSTKVINNNMPLYFPCPCRAQNTFLAQLMRIHVVTPKAPVNIILDPKVLVGKYTFTLGCSILPMLSQSAYWILRLPYVYQGDNEIIAPPEKIEPTNRLAGGCILAGLFGIAETESMELKEPRITSMTFTRLQSHAYK
ncbi:GH11308 [Drosophila grimshawi]|uniref:Nonsense-mediated mRNA decay factor SMG8 n=1 Tax=Drosophila grimshawi TaxID=7222 RepID=SMG8_DROGR|nr:RecName: Full=Nonsense-mediated mRNA decay factor SMG8; AltName: Full=Protein smg-8 homolog [Drosophila grimshawi]EDW03572.1 GH11308 [Drosophila grimshawi]